MTTTTNQPGTTAATAPVGENIRKVIATFLAALGLYAAVGTAATTLSANGSETPQVAAAMQDTSPG